VTGAYAAIAVGCSAPTVLRQLGSARLTSALGLAIVEPEHEREHVDEPEHSATTEPALKPEHAATVEEHA